MGPAGSGVDAPALDENEGRRPRRSRREAESPTRPVYGRPAIVRSERASRDTLDVGAAAIGMRIE